MWRRSPAVPRAAVPLILANYGSGANERHTSRLGDERYEKPYWGEM
jgi:hypothetical protein